MVNFFERIQNGQLRGCYFYNYHSHQPYLVKDGRITGNLRAMWESDNDKDRYEARMFYQCYLNPAQHVMRAVAEGKPNARCMVDYSGTLLEQILDMDRDGLFAAEGMPGFVDTFRECFSKHPDNLELLLIPWSHPYLDGGCPPEDFSRQIARGLELTKAIFVDDVAGRVKGLFPPEMGLPSDPDALYTLIKGCHEHGLTWMLVNETSLEDSDGNGVPSGYPYQLYVKNRSGEEASITVLTRVHDIYQSEGGGHAAAKSSLQSRLGENENSEEILMIGSAGDLENGGVMMNEHWGPWLDAVGDGDDSPICAATGTGYLEAVLARKNGGTVDWSVAADTFKHVHSKGGSWTYGSEHWTKGENKETLDTVTDRVSELHNRLMQNAGGPHPADARVAEAWYAAERALFILETSCYRYWGDSGDWMEAGFALIDNAIQAVNNFAEVIAAPERLEINDRQVTIKE